MLGGYLPRDPGVGDANKSLITYASCDLLADYLYILAPRRCLLELVSDSLKARCWSRIWDFDVG